MSTPAAPRSTATQRRVALATLIGTTIEWYDFFIYATMAGLIFAQLFFEPAGSSIGLLLSFASVGISFLFRPLGAFLAGHFGDRIGRRAILVATLMLMGGATTLIGFLPTYDTVGLAAPVMLILLRIIQGISAGGEWGGAVLMAVEHADDHRRGRAGAFPQMGVPVGMLLASGVTALMTGWIAPGQAFIEWGWRVPFLLSIVLIVVGYFVRRSVDESPVFLEIAAVGRTAKVPIVTLFRRHGLLVLIAALVFAGNNAAGYMATGGFIPAYATSPAVGLERTEVMVAIVYVSAIWIVTTYVGAALSDVLGRKKVYLIGFTAQLLASFPLFWLINTGELPMLYLALTLFSVGIGFSYGPQSALYSELFPASVRFSGVSISYALGAILGGAFAPTIAQALLNATGTSTAISWYLVGMTVLSMMAVCLIKDRTGIDLSITNQAEQEIGATVYDRRRPAGVAEVVDASPANSAR